MTLTFDSKVPSGIVKICVDNHCAKILTSSVEFALRDKTVSDYDLKIPLSHTDDQPTAPIRESPSQFEDRIMARVYISSDPLNTGHLHTDKCIYWKYVVVAQRWQSFQN